VTNSTDPLLAASKLAIAGNVIDLALQSNYGDIKSTGELALVSPLAITMRMFGGKLLCR